MEQSLLKQLLVLLKDVESRLGFSEQEQIVNLIRSLEQTLAEPQANARIHIETGNIDNSIAAIGSHIYQVVNQLNLPSDITQQIQELLHAEMSLSPAPLTKRSLQDLPLVGRAKELNWLAETSGDKVVVGQPGIGKTALLYQYAQQSGALFAVNRHWAELAVAIRRLQPIGVIVDDTHLEGRSDLLLKLRHFRNTESLTFEIIASSWSSDSAISEVTQALELTQQQVQNLQLLTRDEIVEVIHQAGVIGPTELVRLIQQQSEGRPGLAVTLVDLCKRGDIGSVIDGSILSQDLRVFFEKAVGKQSTYLLAVLSLAGQVGLPIEEASKLMQLKRFEVADLINELAYGGVVMTTGENYLVRPPIFRYALVKDVFFNSPASSYLLSTIQAVENQISQLDELTNVLIGAKRLGANIPNRLIQSYITQSHRADVWENYAGTDPDMCSWVLDNFPERFESVVHPALAYHPRRTLPELLKMAVSDQRPLNSNPDHPLRLIEDWIKSAESGTTACLERRLILLEMLKEMPANDAPVVIAHALQTAFSPDFEVKSSDAGQGFRLTIRFGYVSKTEMTSLHEAWERVIPILNFIDLENSGPLRRLAHDWAFQMINNVKISDEAYATKKAFAKTILESLVEQYKERPAISVWASELAASANIEIKTSLATDFEQFYPSRPRGKDYPEVFTEYHENIKNLALKLSNHDPHRLLAFVSSIERDAIALQRRWPRMTQAFWSEVASSQSEPVRWIKALLDIDNRSLEVFQPDDFYPFVARFLTETKNEPVSIILEFLEKPPLRLCILSYVLRTPDFSAVVMEHVLRIAGDFAHVIGAMALRDEISSEYILLLLNHVSPEVRKQTAIGLWHANSSKVSNNLLPSFHTVVVETFEASEDYILGEIGQSHPQIGEAWLLSRLEEDDFSVEAYHDGLGLLISSLTSDMARNIIEKLKDQWASYQIFAELIAHNPELYREFLQREAYSRFHLAPLAGEYEDGWEQRAVDAMQAGYPARDIVGACFGMPYKAYVTSGNQSDMWAQRAEWFKKLEQHEKPQLREVGKLGRAHSIQRMNEELERERHEAVFG